jgi:hypothetical protein
MFSIYSEWLVTSQTGLAVNAKLMSVVEDLFQTGYNLFILLFALRSRQALCTLRVSFESNVTPRYFVSLIHSLFVLKFLTG